MQLSEPHIRPRGAALAVSALLALPLSAVAQTEAPGELARRLQADLACTACHAGVEVETGILDKAPDLSEAGLRYSPAYLLGFLRYPVRVREEIGLSRMPDFRLDERESLALTLFLGLQLPEGASAPDFPAVEEFERVREAHPDVDAALGEEIFVALNCRGCHILEAVPAVEEKTAPDLGAVGARLQGEWIRAFLTRPQAVRPFGYRPGRGGRHPDFRLTDEEAGALADELVTWTGDAAAPEAPLDAEPLHPHSMRKAEALLRDRQPCLACHRLGDEGGRIGPDLSSLGTRLQADYVYRIIQDPQAVVPGSAMPRVEMPDETRRLIAAYLVQQELPRDSAAYPSLAEHEPLPRGLGGVEALYAQRCAACHGVQGRGDGFNAPYLPVTPTNHADSTTMATRPDDTLFDGIYAGGYILGKSHRMPPWGFTLERSQIRELVGYLRDLCRCVGPSWTRGPG